MKSRREFIKSAIFPEPTAPLTFRTNPKTGDKVGVLGYGAMRYPTKDGQHACEWSGGSNAPIDQEEVNRQVDWMLAHGINYFDTSPVYCRGESEQVLANALLRHDRNKYFIATKLSNFSGAVRSFEKSKAMYEKSRSIFKTDHIDYYLLHSCGGGKGIEEFNSRFVNNGIMDFLLAERAAGRIRNLGFSFHGSLEVWHHLMDLHQKYHWDFVQIELNYVDWHHATEVNKRNPNAEILYNDLAARKIPAVIMEPLLGGRLAKFNYAIAEKLVPLDPTKSLASWAIRFAAQLPNVLTVLSGMTYMEHIQENTLTLSPLKPLDARELAALEAAAVAMLNDPVIPCNSCGYCMPCPYGIDIPTALILWNNAVAEKRLPTDIHDPNCVEKAERFLADYSKSLPPLRETARCTGCGRCSVHCPQSIDIPSALHRIDTFVETLRRQRKV